MNYQIGQTYWVSNPKAGKNKQTCGELLGWAANNTLAILYNKRWGMLYASIDNLNKHNKDNI